MISSASLVDKDIAQAEVGPDEASGVEMAETSTGGGRVEARGCMRPRRRRTKGGSTDVGRMAAFDRIQPTMGRPMRALRIASRGCTPYAEANDVAKYPGEANPARRATSATVVVDVDSSMSARAVANRR